MLSFNANPVQNVLAGFTSNINTAGLQNQLAGSDIIVNTIQGNVALTTSPVLLFDLILDVAGSAPTGSFPVDIADGTGFFNVSDDNQNSLADDVVINSGSVNIVAVPEPSSIALLIGFAGCVVMRRRRTA